MKKVLIKTIGIILLILAGIIGGIIMAQAFLDVQTKEKIVTKVVEVEKPEGKELNYLSTLANDKLKDLGNTDYWSHTNSDGCDFGCRAAKPSDRPLETVGENLYKGNCDLETSLRLWKESPTHKAILDKGFTNLVMMGKQKGDMCYVVYNVTFK